MSDHERIAQVAHQKWANLSFFSQKNKLRKPMSEFPALKWDDVKSVGLQKYALLDKSIRKRNSFKLLFLL